MKHPLRLAAVMACFALPVTAGSIDDALVDLKPCEAIPGFDRTDEIKLNAVDLSYRRDVIKIRAEGDVECTASGSGLMRGNLSARVNINSELDSKTCNAEKTAIGLSSLGGTAGAILASKETEVEDLLSTAMRVALESECKRSLGKFME